jgi:spore germination cell wall hydrolase CwlJ-like protein
MAELADLIRKLDDQTVLALNEFFEARGEFAKLSDIAYAAVSCVVLNRAAHPNQFPDSIQEVLAAPYQFSWTNLKDPQHSKALDIARSPGSDWGNLWEEALRVAKEVLAGTCSNPVKNATYYFNPAVCGYPSWSKELRLVKRIGAHEFYADPNDPKVLWEPAKKGE